MSFLQCPKGCVRPVTRYRNGVATFRSTPRAGAAEVSAQQVPVPVSFRNDFDEMVAWTPFAQNPPALEFFNTLHGVGGLFVPDQWAILIGIEDQTNIATDVIASWPEETRALCAGSRKRRPTPRELRDFVLEAAIRRCMAHELGHACLALGNHNPYAPDQEAGADYYAGRFDAAVSRNRQLGAMFFYSIGCVAPSCSHPRPVERAAAYGAGYDDQLGR